MTEAKTKLLSTDDMRELVHRTFATAPEIAERTLIWLAAEEIDRLRKVNTDMLAALGPMRIALQKQVDILRFQARDSTAGVARTLIETADGWQALCDNAEAALSKAGEV